MDPVALALEGQQVRLEPLDLREHLQGLAAIGLEPELWRWTSSQVRDRGDLDRYLQLAVDDRDRGAAIPYAIVHRGSGRVAGCTRLGNIERSHKRVEIGWTWVGLPFQRSAVNTETKYLLFQQVFEGWDWNRVELKTSSLNEKSKAAMRRLG